MSNNTQAAEQEGNVEVQVWAAIAVQLQKLSLIEDFSTMAVMNALAAKVKTERAKTAYFAKRNARLEARKSKLVAALAKCDEELASNGK